MVALPLATWARRAMRLAVGLAIHLGYGRRNVERARTATAPRRDDGGLLTAEGR